MLQIQITKQLSNYELDVDISLNATFTALFGPSGAGKTSILNLVTGLLRPDQGSIRLGNRLLFSQKDGMNLKPQARNIGYVFQEPRLFPHLSVEQNLLFGFGSVSAKSRKFELDEIIDILDIEHLVDRSPRNLSGGEQRRVALGRALLAAPSYLLLDEPLAGLELSARLSFLTFLRHVHRQLGIPILYVSHDLASVLHFAEEVVLLQEGRISAQGKPRDLMEQLQAPPLLPSEDISNILHLEITARRTKHGMTEAKSGKMHYNLPPLNCKKNEKLLLNIPASEIILSLDKSQGLSASNVLPGTIQRIDHLGSRVLVDVDAGDTFTVEILDATVSRLSLRTGMQVYLIFKASSFRRL